MLFRTRSVLRLRLITAYYWGKTSSTLPKASKFWGFSSLPCGNRHNFPSVWVPGILSNPFREFFSFQWVVFSHVGTDHYFAGHSEGVLCRSLEFFLYAEFSSLGTLSCELNLGLPSSDIIFSTQGTWQVLPMFLFPAHSLETLSRR